MRLGFDGSCVLVFGICCSLLIKKKKFLVFVVHVIVLYL